ncbi:beta-lactamase [Exophiala aquamarina CBS 119918]|uniref:Beta-lactamase n=1 Tax=Exophiala aquamarina CBS 119918 TaxID=1182545 RepID=A0A072NY61_9EURO|nr:beta-lactamase [Exophiala aquamarina CBS 119918]KEF52342.1 beta-lactamase [Exophiala aquamarina CBS 119918]
MAEIQGTYGPAFQKLVDLFQDKLSEGEELGGAININISGEDVVNVWAGYTDQAKTTSWAADTITNVYSSTKTVAAIAILVAHERGLLSVDDPVAKLWPEFAENGKEKILIRHVMSHNSGVSGWEGPITMEEVCDVPYSTARLAKQAPWWEAGTGSGYHATTQGHLLGEIIRRATGKPMKQFVAEELAGPLKADFQIGAREEDWPRITPVVPPPPPSWDVNKLDQTGIVYKSLFNPRTSATFSRTPLWRKADMSAVNGHGTAKGLNQILRAVTLSGTSHDDAKLLSPETVQQIFRTQSESTDLVLSIPLRLGIGFAIGGGPSAQTFNYLPQEKMCFWAGWGGSFAICDLYRGVTFTYVMNKMGTGIIGNERSIEYARMAWQILKQGEDG